MSQDSRSTPTTPGTSLAKVTLPVDPLRTAGDQYTQWVLEPCGVIRPPVHPSTPTSIHPPVHPTSNSTSICPPIQSYIPSIHLPSIPTFVCPPSTPTSIQPSIIPPVHPTSIPTSVHPSISTFVCPSIHSPIPWGHLLQAVPCTGPGILDPPPYSTATTGLKLLRLRKLHGGTGLPPTAGPHSQEGAQGLSPPADKTDVKAPCARMTRTPNKKPGAPCRGARAPLRWTSPFKMDLLLRDGPPVSSGPRLLAEGPRLVRALGLTRPAAPHLLCPLSA